MQGTQLQRPTKNTLTLEWAERTLTSSKLSPEDILQKASTMKFTEQSNSWYCYFDHTYFAPIHSSPITVFEMKPFLWYATSGVPLSFSCPRVPWVAVWCDCSLSPSQDYITHHFTTVHIYFTNHCFSFGADKLYISWIFKLLLKATSIKHTGKYDPVSE